jgi:Outer membrane protein beta-barrel domain
MNRKLFLLLLFCIAALSAHAQQFRYGFKTGLNFARFKGDVETDAAGKGLETWENVTGFHIGAAFSYEFVDAFALRGELLYSKRGARYTFDGPSYRSFESPKGVIRSTGNSKYQILVNNSYVDIPVMAVVRVKDFEFSGGVYAGLLIQSIGEGGLVYSDGRTAAPLNNPIAKLSFNLDHNYRKDGPKEGGEGETLAVAADGQNLTLPKTLGAYYDYPESKGDLYKTLDYGLTGGISYYISSSLYFGLRVQYGLADITNNDADLAKGQTGPNNALIFREDNDRNFAIQASVGFKF